MTTKTALTAALIAALALGAPSLALAKGHNNGIKGAGVPTLGGDTAGKGGNAVSDLVRPAEVSEKVRPQEE